jgi:hypothetical protein
VDVAAPALNSKLLASFKLPKFDGVARSWKAWEKSFQRFLGLHQLDYVLEEDFLEQLWVTPGAKAANKMVFFKQPSANYPLVLERMLNAAPHPALEEQLRADFMAMAGMFFPATPVPTFDEMLGTLREIDAAVGRWR